MEAAVIHRDSCQVSQQTKPSTHVWIQAPNQGCTKTNRRAAPSGEAPHHVHGLNTGTNYGGRRIKKAQEIGGWLEQRFYATVKRQHI